MAIDYRILLEITRARQPETGDVIVPEEETAGRDAGTQERPGGASVTVGLTAPPTSSPGDFWFNTEDATLYVSLYDASNTLVFVKPK